MCEETGCEGLLEVCDAGEGGYVGEVEVGEPHGSGWELGLNCGFCRSGLFWREYVRGRRGWLKIGSVN